MLIEEVGIRGIVESRIATKVSFLVSRFLLLISPVTLETSFLNSTFKIQRSAFDIILIFVASRYMMRTMYYSINVECPTPIEE